MNAYHFIKHFVCPHCNERLTIPCSQYIFDENGNISGIIGNAKEYRCSCNESCYLSYPRSDTLVVYYSRQLKIELHVSPERVVFQISDLNSVSPYNLDYIPDFIRESVEDTIQHLETLVTFQ